MIEFVEGGLLVRNGFVGGPMKVEGEDIVSLSIADEDDDDLIESSIDIKYIKVG